MEQLEYDKTGVVEALRSIAERRGVKAVKERSYTGASGLKHLFDLTLFRGGDDVMVDVAYSRDVVDEKGDCELRQTHRHRRPRVCARSLAEAERRSQDPRSTL